MECLSSCPINIFVSKVKRSSKVMSSMIKHCLPQYKLFPASRAGRTQWRRTPAPCRAYPSSLSCCRCGASISNTSQTGRQVVAVAAVQLVMKRASRLGPNTPRPCRGPMRWPTRDMALPDRGHPSNIAQHPCWSWPGWLGWGSATCIFKRDSSILSETGSQDQSSSLTREKRHVF